MAPTDGPSSHGMIGGGPAVLALYRRFELVAGPNATALIRGERGTGKELVGNAVQELRSARSTVDPRLHSIVLRRA